MPPRLDIILGQKVQASITITPHNHTRRSRVSDSGATGAMAEKTSGVFFTIAHYDKELWADIKGALAASDAYRMIVCHRLLPEPLAEHFPRWSRRGIKYLYTQFVPNGGRWPLAAGSAWRSKRLLIARSGLLSTAVATLAKNTLAVA